MKNKFKFSIKIEENDGLQNYEIKFKDIRDVLRALGYQFSGHGTIKDEEGNLLIDYSVSIFDVRSDNFDDPDLTAYSYHQIRERWTHAACKYGKELDFGKETELKEARKRELSLADYQFDINHAIARYSRAKRLYIEYLMELYSGKYDEILFHEKGNK